MPAEAVRPVSLGFWPGSRLRSLLRSGCLVRPRCQRPWVPHCLAQLIDRARRLRDPQKDIGELAAAIGASEDDVEDALHELRDVVTVSFDRVLPKADFFATFAKHSME